MGMHGSALVAIDDERAALATVLVLQEMGLVVDIVVDRERSVDWAVKANYSYVFCGGDDSSDVTDYAIRMRLAVPGTHVIALAGPGFDHSELDAAGVEVMPSPIDVNVLVDRLWPAQAA
ncbi:MAG TPA: hypothetical protein QF624_03745 [Dehalococcoidia bacterium]|nr:hypothetical protein [Dehalococcoidia bacterium]